MKSVLISTQPKWCDLTASGEKTIEVRKTAPKEVPFKAYIYCTKDKPYLYRIDDDNNFELTNTLRPKTYEYVKDYNEQNGKVIGEYICDNVDEYTFSHYEAEYRVTHAEQKGMCLNQPELILYGKGKTLYGWHISDLKIYDKPRELSEFATLCNKSGNRCANCRHYLFDNDGLAGYQRWCDVYHRKPLARAPQSWCYVEVYK